MAEQTNTSKIPALVIRYKRVDGEDKFEWSLDGGIPIHALISIMELIKTTIANSPEAKRLVAKNRIVH